MWDQNPAYRIGARVARRARSYSIHEERMQASAASLAKLHSDRDVTPGEAGVEIGGKVVKKADESGVAAGRAQDSQGAMFAVSAQLERSRYGAQVGEFSWHELLTTNSQTAWEFYSKLFGWEKTEAMDMGPNGIYQMFGTGGNTLGGMFTPRGNPGGPMWVPYVLLRDAKRAAETAKELGATIAHGPEEVPGGDWVFTGIDRQGAVFAVHSKKRVAPVTTKPAKDITKDRSEPEGHQKGTRR